MKRLVWFLLLLSLGLNVGLGLRLLRDEPTDRTTGRGHPRHDGAPRRGGGHGPHHDGSGMERFRGLGLDPGQRASLQDLREARWEAMNGLHERLGEFRTEMRTLFEQPELDRERVAAVRRRHGRLQAELDSLVTEQLLQEMAILTPAQRREYLERMPWRRRGSGRR